MRIAERRLRQVLAAALRLRCPRCRVGALFRGAFSMNARCPVCGLIIEREQGYFVGAMYVNYAVTVGLACSGFLLLDHYATIPLRRQLLLWGTFAAAFPVLFFRHARSLWLAINHIFNPPAPAAVRKAPDGKPKPRS